MFCDLRRGGNFLFEPFIFGHCSGCQPPPPELVPYLAKGSGSSVQCMCPPSVRAPWPTHPHADADVGWLSSHETAGRTRILIWLLSWSTEQHLRTQEGDGIFSVFSCIEFPNVEGGQPIRFLHVFRSPPAGSTVKTAVRGRTA